MRTRWPAFLAALTTLAARPQASARASECDASCARLLASHGLDRYGIPVPGNSVEAGGARAAVNAPLPVVRAVLSDYGRYSEFIPGFQKSRVLDRNPGGTDVYLEVPILHGATKLWAVTRFTGPTADERQGERIEGRRQAQGNLDELRTVWRYYAADAQHTIVTLELLIIPKLPVPAAILNGELLEAATRTVVAARDEAERSALGAVNRSAAAAAAP